MSGTRARHGRAARDEMNELDAGFVPPYNVRVGFVPKRIKEDDNMALPETIRKAAKEKAYIRRFGLKLNVNTDADIIDYLQKQPSMQGYIKQLIREDIARNTTSEK